MGSKVGKIFKQILPIAAPILGSLLLPGLGTALGIGGLTTATGAATSLGGALGGGLGGAAGGGFGGGGFSGALKGGLLGAGGGYLANGGASELFGGTQLGNTLGLGNPAGGSLIGNAIGSTPGSTATLGSSLSGLLSGSGVSPLSSADNAFLGAAKASANGLSGADSAFLSNAGAGLSGSGNAGSGLGALTNGGAGIASGGSSSYSTLGALLGGANSLYANDQAQSDLLDAQKNALGQIQPYTASGAAANTKLSDLLGTGTNTGTAGYGSLAKPFTPDDLTKDPGFQFNLKQGDQALARRQAASGNYFSGSALKEAQQFGQGLADNTYNNAFQRNQSQNNDIYNKFAGQAGAGQNAANTAGGIFQNTGNAKANAGISSSNIFNQTLSSLLSGSGAKRPINIGGQIVYI